MVKRRRTPPAPIRDRAVRVPAPLAATGRGTRHHIVSSGQLEALFPWVSGAAAGSAGPVMAKTVLGGEALPFDPLLFYEWKWANNPTTMVCGGVGHGKSSFVKSFIKCQAPLGRAIAILDVKGEYTETAQRLGTVPVVVRPGGAVRINPLDIPTWGVSGRGIDVGLAQTTALKAFAGLAVGRGLSPDEERALGVALRHLRHTVDEVTLPMVVDVLGAVPGWLADDLGYTTDALRTAMRSLRNGLNERILARYPGMFDGPTRGVDWSSKHLVIDVSAFANDPEALQVVMTAAMSLFQSRILAATAQQQRIVLVFDEAWRVFGILALVRALESLIKLCRALGIVIVYVFHSMADLLKSDAGSELRGVTQGLLNDTGIQVVYAQGNGGLAAATEMLRLTPAEVDAVGRATAGVALWRIGVGESRTGKRFQARHLRSRDEEQWTDTDEALTGVSAATRHDPQAPTGTTGTASTTGDDGEVAAA